MTEVKKRNELSIFEELRLKPDDFQSEVPKIEDLEEIDDVYYYYNQKFKKNTYWVLTEPKYTQVNEFRQSIETDDENYQLNVPQKNSLKQFKTDVKVHIEEETEETIVCTWWKENEDGKLIQVNRTDETESIKFKLKSWLRNKAIDAVGLEIRSMKKKAYEYSKEELIEMIELEEGELKKKGAFKALKVAALSSLGLSWLPFI
ncbi:hypothetical protein N9N53_03500 [Candidatus Pelagibacter bacterium]|jgi:hypothetical protein|nr:hypothetical protein [Candidatus Pelagibacter bacterium]MDA8836036.1 hypothetical protein [Candidatus Pelagibacter bacterium]